jgi:hypothetical protein
VERLFPFRPGRQAGKYTFSKGSGQKIVFFRLFRVHGEGSYHEIQKSAPAKNYIQSGHVGDGNALLVSSESAENYRNYVESHAQVFRPKQSPKAV